MADGKNLTIDASKLPEGMTAEKLIALVESVEARAESGERQRKIRSHAVQKLVDAHKAEYEANRAEAAKLYEAGKL